MNGSSFIGHVGPKENGMRNIRMTQVLAVWLLILNASVFVACGGQPTSSGATPTEPGSALRDLGVASYETIKEGADWTSIILQDSDGREIGRLSGSLVTAGDHTITWHDQLLNVHVVSRNADGLQYTLNGRIVDAAAAQEELRVLDAMREVVHQAVDDADTGHEESCTCNGIDFTWKCCAPPIPGVCGILCLCPACAGG
jgi:hypothetical protein